MKMTQSNTAQKGAKQKNKNYSKKKPKKSLLGTIGTLVILALYIWFEFGTPQDNQVTLEERKKVELIRQFLANW